MSSRPSAQGTRYKISLLPSEPYICVDGHLIERVNSYKYLGVQVDETLSWEAHIFEVVSEVAKVLAALRRLTPICPQSTIFVRFGGISGEFGRAKVPMVRPNEPHMSPKRTTKVRLGIYRTQIRL